ncbi:MAG TPA: nuclear transport factor 2 family protein [Longimicrobium sp.]|jgi:ketosteroid isomerase-like protein
MSPALFSRARVPRLLVCAIVCVAAALSAGAARAQSVVADSIRALDSAWARAYATHDTTLAQRLFADDVVITSSSGTMKSREDEIRDVRPDPALQMHFFRTTNVDVRLRPGMAVVTGVAEWEFTYNGRLSAVRRRYTSVFARGGPLGWQMVALHLGASPPQQRPGGT